MTYLRRSSILTVLAFSVTTGAAMAQHEPIDRFVKKCSPTYAMKENNYPGFETIMSNSRLAQPPGKSIPADGQPLYVIGRVFDQQCAPISEAKIELWQANPMGSYTYASKEQLATPNAVFAGAGRTSADNNGQFVFYTLFPGTHSVRVGTDKRGKPIYQERAPHFNLRISHRDFAPRDYTIFFAGDERNASDPYLKKLNADQQHSIEAQMRQTQSTASGMQAVIDITVPGRSGFKHF